VLLRVCFHHLGSRFHIRSMPTVRVSFHTHQLVELLLREFIFELCSIPTVMSSYNLLPGFLFACQITNQTFPLSGSKLDWQHVFPFRPRGICRSLSFQDIGALHSLHFTSLHSRHATKYQEKTSSRPPWCCQKSPPLPVLLNHIKQLRPGCRSLWYACLVARVYDPARQSCPGGKSPPGFDPSQALTSPTFPFPSF